MRFNSPRQQERNPVRLTCMEAETFKSITETSFRNGYRMEVCDIEQQWLSIKAEMATAVECIRKSRKIQQKRKNWISDEAWSVIKKRKELKSQGLNTPKEKDEYARLSNNIQRLCRRDKNCHLSNICAEVEQHAEKFQTGDLFKKVKQITRKVKHQSWMIENRDGVFENEVTKVAERWKEYCADLYSGDHTAHTTQPTHCIRNACPAITDQEPDILRSEVIAAIKKLKSNKAPGTDLVTAEALKALGERGIEHILKLCNSIWSSTIWPEDWTHSSILPLHKKGSTKKCDNYRTIALISHPSKVLLHIINNRLRHYLDWQIPQVQAGFVKGKGTREQILNMRLIVEKCYEFNTPAVFCFVDYQKAFDCVSWVHLWHVLGDMGVPSHLITLIKNLYESGYGTVKVGTVRSSAFRFAKGVRQGCIISPILFNIYGEYIMRKTLEGWEGGITVGGLKISNLRYADDTTLLTGSEAEMLNLLERLEFVSRDMGLKINQAKTKIMIVDRSSALRNAHILNQYDIVQEFTYLGSSISNRGGSENEIRRRIGMAKSAMAQLGKVWKDRNILRKTKTYIVRTLVFPICMYGAESWTIKAADRRRIDAFEMWCWRRMLGIPWTAFRTNVSILKELNVTQRLSSTCLKRILTYFGHVARKPPDNLERLLVTGKVEGKRPRGRSPTRWADQVAKQLSTRVSDAFRWANDRNKWRQLVKKFGREHHDAQQ